MRVVIADDDRLARWMLARTLERWDFEVDSASDGESAWTLICERSPAIAILDWMMPQLDGPSLCRRIRLDEAHASLHVVLLSARDGHPDLLAGLEAGADDYLIKPFDPDELKARLNVGIRIIGLQQRLSEQVAALQEALTNVRQLQGLLPICSYCKAVRSDQNYWEQIDSYLAQHTDAQFSHGVCPDCLDKAMNDPEIPLDTPRSRFWKFGRDK